MLFCFLHVLTFHLAFPMINIFDLIVCLLFFLSVCFQCLVGDRKRKTPGQSKRSLGIDSSMEESSTKCAGEKNITVQNLTHGEKKKKGREREKKKGTK